MSDDDATPGVQSWTPDDAVARLAAALGGRIRPARAPRARPGRQLPDDGTDVWAAVADDGTDGQHHD